jgi:quercetin dioxygenase-like cupin family protein
MFLKIHKIAYICVFCFSVNGALAGDVSTDYQTITVTPLLTNPKTIIGETIAYPGGTPANITAAIVSIGPGQKTGLHGHGVPLFAYMLSGELEVDYGDKGVKVYTKGMAFMEAMEQVHEGRNTKDIPAEILAVYMGANGYANVTKPEKVE